MIKMEYKFEGNSKKPIQRVRDYLTTLGIDTTDKFIEVRTNSNGKIIRVLLGSATTPITLTQVQKDNIKTQFPDLTTVTEK